MLENIYELQWACEATLKWFQAIFHALNEIELFQTDVDKGWNGFEMMFLFHM